MLVITGAGAAAALIYSNPFDNVTLCPSGLVTTTSAVPAVPAGTVTFILVALK